MLSHWPRDIRRSLILTSGNQHLSLHPGRLKLMGRKEKSRAEAQKSMYFHLKFILTL